MTSLFLQGGKLLLNDGKLATSEDCCCCEECSHGPFGDGCGGTIPKYLKVTISGVLDCASGGDCTDVNGSWVLECENQTFSRWNYDDGSVGVVIFFNTAGGGNFLVDANVLNGGVEVCFLQNKFGGVTGCACTDTVNNGQDIGDCDCTGTAQPCGYDGTFSWEPSDALGNTPCVGCTMAIP